MKRAYRLGKRAVTAAETRLRIVEAALALYQSVGPRQTTVAEIARRAGVERLTVYNHFADDAALALACQSFWRTLHPRPESDAWSKIEAPAKRLEVALDALFAWYAETEAMTRNVLRDGPADPAFAGVLAAIAQEDQAFIDSLVAGWQPTPWALAALRAGIGFGSWESLCLQSGLPRDEAVALVVTWVRSA